MIDDRFGTIDVGSHTDTNAFEYDALKDQGRRRTVTRRIVREDNHLRSGKRDKLSATTADIETNFSIAAWAIRQHLDYVSRFDIHVNTGDREFDKEIMRLIGTRSTPTACDRGRRFFRERLFRIAESMRVVNGDAGLYFLGDARTQLIESDLIRQPTDYVEQRGKPEWCEGVQIDTAGAQLKYCLHRRRRGGYGYEQDRKVDSKDFHLYGFFKRSASDQIRGVSPIVASLNQYRDVYEAVDYALIKAKVSQLFMLAIMRDVEADPLDETLGAGTEPTEDCSTDEPPERSINLSGGPQILDLDPKEKAEFLESKTPPTELQNFTKLCIGIGLKALDIPYSFYDEAYTNYSGQRSGWLRYNRSAMTAREDQIEMRRQWLIRQFRWLIITGELILPSGWNIGTLLARCEWVPLGMPWWKPSEEINGNLQAIASGLDNPQRVAKEHGRGDVFDNLDKTHEVIEYARSKGMELNFAPHTYAAEIITQASE